MQKLVKEAEIWIVHQRDAHIKDGRRFSAEERQGLAPYFEAELMDKVRLVPVEYIENPPFYTEIKRLAGHDILDFTQMSGLAFIDCILLSQSKPGDPHYWPSFLFHEMVHVAQYEILGVERFAEEYVRGWSERDFDYWSIPLEREAYELMQLAESTDDHFSVTNMLRERHPEK